MRLDSPGLTGPPTTTRGKRKRKKKEDEESRVVYRCCSLFRRLATSKQRQRQHRHRYHCRQENRQQQEQQQQQQHHHHQQQQQQQQQHQRRRRRRQRRQQLHGEHEDGPAARNATAFRASRHPPFRSVVRARYHAVTPTLEAEQGEHRAADRLSASRPQRRRCPASTSRTRKKKGIAGRHRRSSIFNDRIFLRGYTLERLSVRALPANGFANGPILLSTAPSSLDVLANTAFKVDDDDDEDDDEDKAENVPREFLSRRRHHSSTIPYARVQTAPGGRSLGEIEIELYTSRCESWTVQQDSENRVETGATTVLIDPLAPTLENGREYSNCRLSGEKNGTNGIEKAERKTFLDNVIDDDREKKRRREGSGSKRSNEYPDGSPKPTLGWRGGRGGNWPPGATTNRQHDRHCQERWQQHQQHHYRYQQHQQLSRRSRNYGLLLLLYLLTWPLLCSSNSSSQHPSSVGFGQNSALGSGENLVRERNNSQRSNGSGNAKGNGNDIEDEDKRNGTTGPRGSPFSPSAGVSAGEAQRYVQEEEEYGMRADQGSRYLYEAQAEAQKAEVEEFYRDRQVFSESGGAHPYNEYSWEVNQINPWLSACDLAGPAPADLQGSCGPPEVPKNCPAACAVRSRGGGPEAHFLEVIEKLQATEYGSSGRKGVSGVTWPDAQLAAMKAEGEDEGMKRRKKRKKKDDNDEDDDERPAPEQCLFYLEESHKRDICRDDFGRASTRSFLTPRQNRYWFMSGLRLRHCCEHAVVNALAPGKGGPLEDVLNGGRKCADALDKLLLVDALAARLHCEFEEVLARYDCAQPYSVIHNCTHCKEAYRKWVCSSLVPYFAHGGPQDLESSEGTWTRIRPCLSLCQSVEQRCPYLLPGDRAPAYPTQYAGEPTFLCRDPNILETGEQATRALHSSDERECCFHVCSEKEPGSGICANCTDREPRKRGREHDPPTAPHCEITPIQSGSAGEEEAAAGWPASTDGKDIESASTSTSFPTVVHDQHQQQQQHQGTSLCGTGGVGTITSSGSNRARDSHVAHFLCLSSILIQFFRWSWLLTGSFRRTILVVARNVLFLGRGVASFVVVVVARNGVGGARGGGGGGGGGGGVRSIEEVRPRSRSGWCCFQWWYPSSSSSSSPSSSLSSSSSSSSSSSRSNKRITFLEKEEKYEVEKKKKRRKKRKEDEEEEDCRGVWWRRWWWWRSWRRRRKNGRNESARIGTTSSELLPVVIVHVLVLEVRGSRKRTATTRESRRRPRHRRRRYKLDPLRGRCRWRWKEENSARVCCWVIGAGGGEGAAIATPPRKRRERARTYSPRANFLFLLFPSPPLPPPTPSPPSSLPSSSSSSPTPTPTPSPTSSLEEKNPSRTKHRPEFLEFFSFVLTHPYPSPLRVREWPKDEAGPCSR